MSARRGGRGADTLEDGPEAPGLTQKTFRQTLERSSLRCEKLQTATGDKISARQRVASCGR